MVLGLSKDGFTREVRVLNYEDGLRQFSDEEHRRLEELPACSTIRGHSRHCRSCGNLKSRPQPCGCQQPHDLYDLHRRLEELTDYPTISRILREEKRAANRT